MPDNLPSYPREPSSVIAAGSARPSPADYASSQPELEGLGLREIWGMLRRRLWLVLATAAVSLGGTAYLVYTEVPRYRAAAVMRLVDARRAMTGGIADAATGPLMGRTTDPVQSQLLVLQGRPLLGEVVDREALRLVSLSPTLPVGALRDVRVALPEDAADTLQLQFGARGVVARMEGREARAAYGQPLVLDSISLTVPARPDSEESATLAVLPREEAIKSLAEDLRATPRESTDGIDVEFTSADRERARRVVNTVVQVFQSANARAAQQQAVRRRIFLEQQLRETDAQLAQAQTALSGFRSREQVYSSGQRLAAQQAGMMEVQVRRQELDADRRMYQTLLTELQRPRRGSRSAALQTLISSPGIATNPVVAQLYGQLVRFEVVHDSLMIQSEQHPDLERLKSQISATEGRLTEAVRSHIGSLQARTAALEDLQARSGSQLSQLPQSEAEEVRLAQQVQSMQRIGDQLREEYQRARISEAVEAGQVEIVDLASRAEPVPSRRNLKLALGLMLGLMLGSGGALLLEHMNTSIRRREDIETVLRIPGLGVIPQIAATRRGLRGAVLKALPSGNGGPSRGNGDGTHASGLIMTHSSRSPGAEAFRTIRTNLVFSQAVQTLKTLVVTSASPGEGKTTTAANLAATFAQQQARVLLVDCDLRRPKLDHMFAVPREPGLTNVLLGQSTAQDAIRSTGVENLHVLTAGILPPNPYELLGGERMTRLLQALSDRYDMLVIDTAPMMAASDAMVLGAKADGVLLVVRAGSTDRGAAQHATQQLAAVGARVVGAVLNDPDATAEQYGGYYYDYSYSEKT